jgi:hypothetical protein
VSSWLTSVEKRGHLILVFGSTEFIRSPPCGSKTISGNLVLSHRNPARCQRHDVSFLLLLCVDEKGNSGTHLKNVMDRLVLLLLERVQVSIS